MSNFDFLKNFNKELYEIGLRLEDDVVNSPRAVTADATQFLEILVKDMYKQSKHKLERNLISFYKKIDFLYRQGVITYIYKNKLQEAYNLRNKIHNNITDDEEEKLAFDLHQRLFYISKKYFQDFCDDKKFFTIPEYKKPEFFDVRFDDCIICGSENSQVLSNICEKCNKKIEQGNFILIFKNNLGKNDFTRQDLIRSGLSESESIALLMDLSKENILINNGDSYIFNEDNLELFLDDINEYVEISSLITKFYRNEINAKDVKTTEEYYKGSNGQKPYREFYRLVNEKSQKDFEKDLLKFENISKSRRINAFDDLSIQNWFFKQKTEFTNGKMNDAFILYNELLIKDFFKLKRRGYTDSRIFNELELSQDIYDFWQKEFMGKDFLKKTNEIKKEIIISKVRNNKSLNEALRSAGVSEEDFEKLYLISKNLNDNFYKTFNREYTQKRQKLFVKHLRNSNLASAIRLTKITKSIFLRWYRESEFEYSDFYLRTTKILMNRYLMFRKNGWDKTKILKHLGIPIQVFQSWSNHDDLELFSDFQNKNNELTENLIKRGKVINALKEGKSKDEAILDAGLTPKEFLEIYNTSKIEKTDFHIRFDEEYIENRKREFVRLIKTNDFYNAIEKCEISQTDFNKWYLIDQDNYISNLNSTDFYMSTTKQLMKNYLKARQDGKNKPDAARSVGLSNIIINKWLNHTELNLYNDFAIKENQLTIDLIVKGFESDKSKSEVSQIYDIPINIIDEYIEKGKSGFEKYEDISDAYEKGIIPKQLKVFLNDFENRPFNKALKSSKLTKDELNHFYNRGKSGDEEFKDFYNDFLALKKSLYVSNILSKKTHKIALKNSYLTKAEFNNEKEELEFEILKKRMNIVADELLNSKATGLKISKKIGISINEFYDWYFRGKNGDEMFHEFYLLINTALILPRIITVRKALEIGIPKKWVFKKLKKEIGPKDFKIWMDKDIVNDDFVEIMELCEEDDDKPGFLKKFLNVKKVALDVDGESSYLDRDPQMTIINFTNGGESSGDKVVVGH